MQRYLTITFTILLLTITFETFAQADINMTLHWNNRSFYNPASIARPEYIYMNANARSQWYGLEGAPKVLYAQASGYVEPINSAFGFSVINDNIGFTSAINPMISYAYKIDKDNDWTLTFGISGGVFYRSIDFSKFNPTTPTDPALYQYSDNILKPDANFGVEFENNYFVLGASTTHIISIIDENNKLFNANHRYAYTYYKNTNSQLYNYFLGVQMINRGNLTVFEGNARIQFKHSSGLAKGSKNIFDLGISYRTSNILSAIIGLNLSKNLHVSYAYDQSFMPGILSNPTNEIMLEYRIPTHFSGKCKHCPY